jgi:peptidyl-prolyl cis-trans isomerase D
VLAADYEETKREEITIRKMEGLLAAGALVPATEARDQYRLYFRKIRVVLVTADPARMKTPPPTEAEIAAKYEQSKESYRLPARVKLVIAAFTPEHFGKDVRPGEAEIKAFYEGNADRFRTEEKRLVSRVDLPFGTKDKAQVRAKAEEILRNAAKGKAAFEAYAKKRSRGTPVEAWVTRRELAPALAGPVFSASVDAVVGPVELPDRFVLARVNRIRFAETEPLSKVRDQVVALLRIEKGKDQAVIKAYDVQRKAAAGNDLEKLASSLGVPVTKTGWVGADGGPEVPAVVAQDALLLPRGGVGPVKAVGDTQYLFQVTAKEESRVPPLAGVREKVAAAVARQKEIAAARTALTHLLSSSATVSGWFAPLSDPVPEALGTAGDVRRDLATLTAKAPVSPKIFQGKEGRLSGVAFLGEEIPGNAQWEKQKSSFLKALAEQKRNAMLEGFLSDQRERTKVVINPEALK